MKALEQVTRSLPKGHLLYVLGIMVMRIEGHGVKQGSAGRVVTARTRVSCKTCPSPWLIWVPGGEARDEKVRKSPREKPDAEKSRGEMQRLKAREKEE